MEENCSIKLFESDLESMLSQVIAKARSRDEKLKAAKERRQRLNIKTRNSMLSWIWKSHLLLPKKNANF